MVEKDGRQAPNIQELILRLRKSTPKSLESGGVDLLCSKFFATENINKSIHGNLLDIGVVAEYLSADQINIFNGRCLKRRAAKK